MAAVEPLEVVDPDEAAADKAARELLAEALLQLVVEEVVLRPQISRALAALGICHPDLEEARTRRRRWGWRGPRLRVPVKVPTAEESAHFGAMSHSTRRFARANPTPGMKRCAKCGEVKPVEKFALKSETSLRVRGRSTTGTSNSSTVLNPTPKEEKITMTKGERADSQGVSPTPKSGRAAWSVGDTSTCAHEGCGLPIELVESHSTEDCEIEGTTWWHDAEEVPDGVDPCAAYDANDDHEGVPS